MQPVVKSCEDSVVSYTNSGIFAAITEKNTGHLNCKKILCMFVIVMFACSCIPNKWQKYTLYVCCP